MRSIYLPLLAAVAALSGCDPAENVDVLPLPALERPSREARLGIPEVAGPWRFAGWEIIRGDTTSLERTFPSFGELRLDTQRLDSIAGTFDLAGGRRGVMGEIRRDGNLSLVTYGGGDTGRYITGRFAQDTLWLELTSILPLEEWPRDARAAFVRDPVEKPITWLRGARPADQVAPVDSTLAGVDSLGRPLPARVAAPGGPSVQPGTPGSAPAGVAQPAPRPGGVQPAQPPRAQPSGGQTQPQPQPQPRPAAPAPAPAPRPAPPPAARPAPQDDDPDQPEPVRPSPAPAPAPAPPPPPQDDDGPALLGDPIL